MNLSLIKQNNFTVITISLLVFLIVVLLPLTLLADNSFKEINIKTLNLLEESKQVISKSSDIKLDNEGKVVVIKIKTINEFFKINYDDIDTNAVLTEVLEIEKEIDKLEAEVNNRLAKIGVIGLISALLVITFGTMGVSTLNNKYMNMSLMSGVIGMIVLAFVTFR